MDEAAIGGEKKACCSALMGCNKCSLAGTCFLFNEKGVSGLISLKNEEFRTLVFITNQQKG